MPLVDVGTQKTGTEFWQASHTNPDVAPLVLSGALGVEDSAQLALVAADDSVTIVQPDLSAGDMLLYDYRVIHRGPANPTGEARPIYYCGPCDPHLWSADLVAAGLLLTGARAVAARVVGYCGRGRWLQFQRTPTARRLRATPSPFWNMTKWRVGSRCVRGCMQCNRIRINNKSRECRTARRGRACRRDRACRRGRVSADSSTADLQPRSNIAP